MVFLQHFDKQEIQGEPDRPTPVGIPAKVAGGGFTRLVIDRKGSISRRLQLVGMSLVILADPANAIVAEEFLRVKHVLEKTPEIIPTHHCQQHDIFELAYLACVLPARNQAGEIGTILYKPTETFI